MKKRKITAVLFYLTIILNGCGKEISHENVYEKIRRFTFVCPIASGDTYWNSAYEGMKDAAGQIGQIDVMMTGPPRGDMERWIRDFDSAVAARVDGIITTGVRTKIESHINQAWEKGIPVALIDTDVPDSSRLCYIGLDNYKLGQEGIRFIADLGGKDARVGVICLTDEAQNFVDRLEGLKDELKKYPEMELMEIRAAGSVLEASVETEKLLRKQPQINALYCIDGTTPKGAALALIEMGKSSDVLCIGLSDDQEIIDRLRDGSLDGTISLEPYEMGYQAVVNLAAYLNGETVEDTVIPDTVRVTGENVEEFAELKGYQ